MALGHPPISGLRSAVGATLLAALVGAIATTPVANAQSAEFPSRTDLEARVKTLLTEKFGDTFTQAPTVYVKCPASQRQKDKYYGLSQSCRSEFGTSTQRRTAEVEFSEGQDGAAEQVNVQATYGPAYRLRLTSCSKTERNRTFQDSRWTLSRLTVASGEDECREGAQVLDALASAAHSSSRLPSRKTLTPRAADPGFPALNQWTCTRTGTHRQAVRCHTQLGHRIQAVVERRSSD